MQSTIWEILGGPLGVRRGQGGPWVDRRDPGWVEGVPWRFLKGPGEPLEQVTFSLLWGEFVNCLVKY